MNTHAKKHVWSLNSDLFWVLVYKLNPGRVQDWAKTKTHAFESSDPKFDAQAQCNPNGKCWNLRPGPSNLSWLVIRINDIRSMVKSLDSDPKFFCYSPLC
jgi:hypothetical protein